MNQAGAPPPVQQEDGRRRVTGNTLSDPKFKDGEQMRTDDYVVVNPPFSVKTWSNGLTPANDPQPALCLG